jgi:xylan 1,4-beta-xylosidase
MRYQNPVIPGFYPDPSICRVGADYFLVTSSFEYFPGVPLFHSRDLVHWRQIGHCLTRESQLPLDRCPSSYGIYAPTLRFYNGRYYMTTTNVGNGGHFYVWTDDIYGEWSDPIWVDQPGIDPDLFFDADGSVYFTTAAGEAATGIYQSQIDINNGKRETDYRIIWKGTGGAYPEAPHLYRIGSRYYLLLAEGGTEYGHMVTIAAGDRPYGPFESCPANPVLTHRSSPSPIQATGHADMVQAEDGAWWAVCLGVRPVGWTHKHHIGRETFLLPVTCSEDGWPRFGENGRVPEAIEVPYEPVKWELPPERDDFDAPQLGNDWVFLRNPNPSDWSLSKLPGSLQLHGSAVTLNDTDSPAFVGRRQCHSTCSVETSLEFVPVMDGEEAGLAVFMNERFHYAFGIRKRQGRIELFLRKRVGSIQEETSSIPWTAGSVRLRIEALPTSYQFLAGSGGETPRIFMGDGETRLLSTEVAGGFTGVFFGMYATGNGKRATSPAAFDWFEYRFVD